MIDKKFTVKDQDEARVQFRSDPGNYSTFGKDTTHPTIIIGDPPPDTRSSWALKKKRTWIDSNPAAKR